MSFNLTYFYVSSLYISMTIILKNNFFKKKTIRSINDIYLKFSSIINLNYYVKTHQYYIIKLWIRHMQAMMLDEKSIKVEYNIIFFFLLHL